MRPLRKPEKLTPSRRNRLKVHHMRARALELQHRAKGLHRYADRQLLRQLMIEAWL